MVDDRREGTATGAGRSVYGEAVVVLLLSG
jgi:hypothetical protein